MRLARPDLLLIRCYHRSIPESAVRLLLLRELHRLVLCHSPLLRLLLLLLLLLDDVRVVIQSLVELQLLHFLAILYFLVLWNAIARELLAEEIVVGELIGPLLVLLHFWLERGLHLVRSLSRVLWILVHQRVTLNERLR